MGVRHWFVIAALALAGPAFAQSRVPSAGYADLAARLTPAVVPTDLLATTATLSRLPHGLVGVLPWGQYRRYPWNGNRVSLTPPIACSSGKGAPTQSPLQTIR